MTKDTKAYQFNVIFKIFSYVKNYKKVFSYGLFSTIALTILTPLRPYYVQTAIDEYILHFDTKGLIYIVFVLLALIISQSLCQYFQTYYLNVLGQNIILDIRKQLFSHVLKLRLNFFNKNPVGKLITRVVSDLETISEIFSQGILAIIGDLLKIFFILALMIYSSPKLTLFVLLPMPLLFLATYIFKEAIKNAYKDVRLRVAELNTFLQEKITGMLVIQAYAVEDKEKEKFRTINAKHRDAHIRSIWAYSIFYPVVEIILALCLGILIWKGFDSVLGNEVSVGVIVSFIMYINLLFRPIRELADKFNTLQMGMVAGTRIFDILEKQDIVPDTGQIEGEKQSIKGEVEFKHVHFGYKKGQPILHDISFKVKPGDTLAIVGASGAGKSTIIQLINRFYDISEGEILFDGINIKDYKVDFLRRQIGVVLQDPFMYSDTILNNINMGDNAVTKEQIIEAAKALDADRFIDKLEGQYDFNIMERGNTLSAGYIQILSLMRVFVYQPKLLILDEATSSVDTESEIIIQHAINRLMESCTSIVIAHRLSTILHANKILVLDKGEIKESGTHHQLLKVKEGYYKKLYEAQFKHLKVYE